MEDGDDGGERGLTERTPLVVGARENERNRLIKLAIHSELDHAVTV